MNMKRKEMEDMEKNKWDYCHNGKLQYLSEKLTE